MTSRQKRGKKSSIDDVLADLLGDDSDGLSAKPRSPAAGLGRPPGLQRTQSGKRNLLDDDFFSKLAEEAEKDVEGSDVSEADPKALLESMKDLDDMDADLFGSKQKQSSVRKQNETTASEDSKPEQKSKTNQTVEPEERKSSSAPAASVRNYKKFSFLDDDPLGDLLDDLDQDRPKSVPSTKTEKQPSPSISAPQASSTMVPKKRGELTFDDDEDDPIDALGFNDPPARKGSGISPKKESTTPQRARTRLDEILGIGTPSRLLERPLTGQEKDKPTPERAAERTPQSNSAGKESMFGDEDFAFGSYQPTVGSTPEGRTSRRQSVRFSTEDISSSSPEHKPKPNTTSLVASNVTTSTRPSRPASDWLGLNPEEDEEQEKEETKEPKVTPSLKPPSSHLDEQSQRITRKPNEDVRAVTSSPKSFRAGTEIKTKEGEQKESEWLTGALSKKKAQLEDREKKQEELLGLGEEIDLDAILSKRNTIPTPRRRHENTPDLTKQPSTETLVISRGQQSPVPFQTLSTGALNTRESEEKPASVNTAPVQQVSLSTDSLQQLLINQQLAQVQLRGLGAPLGSVQLESEQHIADITALQTKIIQLEGQVRNLQLEKEQLQMLLDSIQQRQQQDTELMESTHRARIKLLEDSAAQREARAQRESQELAERLEAVMKLAQQERTELQEQHQRRLAQCQQERDRDVERLRDLQRKSILEMKKDHEEQVQRLRKLKDEEIDAVTSATSQTRSLTSVIDQMDQFSQRLGELSSRIESTHESTTLGLEQGARQRDEQLRALQERLSQQQREMTEERIRLKEVIAKMDTQLAEQQRQLQQERWRVTAEQAKAESALRGLEEERRTMTQHFTIEREELERAKSALLDEQQSVMQRCAEERRKLAADWSNFHSQEKLRKDRETDREGHIIGMAQEQAELKLKAGELKQREDAVQREKESLEKLRDELQREKEQLNAAALRLKNRAQEVESLSQLACERYEEGERALQEARQVDAAHQTRLRTIHLEMERLRKQEHSLQQERMKVTDYRKDVDKIKPVPTINYQFLPTDTVQPGFSPAFTSTMVLPSAPLQNLSTSVSPELQATLALMRHTAEKDRDFLQDEQFFLDTLKRAPYNSTFHTT